MESLEVTCPHCEHPTTSRGVVPGGIIDCAHCDRSFVLSQSPELVEPDPGSAIPSGRGVALDARFPQLRPAQTAAPTDVSLAASALAAAGLTLLFYVALVRPLQGSYVSELFGQRGWVPYVIAWLSSWSAVLLLVKWRLLARQRESLALDLLPEAIATRITPENAHIFASVARHLSERNAGSFLCRRVLGAVQHFRARRRVQ